MGASGGRLFDLLIAIAPSRVRRLVALPHEARLSEDHEDRVGDLLAAAAAIDCLMGGHRMAAKVVFDGVGKVLALQSKEPPPVDDPEGFRSIEPSSTRFCSSARQ
jgi:hypothetical protein